MSASTGEVWLPQEEPATDRSWGWVGVLLFLGSSVVSVKGLVWLTGTVGAALMQ